jgi:hypothetical protein
LNIFVCFHSIRSPNIIRLVIFSGLDFATLPPTPKYIDVPLPAMAAILVSRLFLSLALKCKDSDFHLLLPLPVRWSWSFAFLGLGRGYAEGPRSGSQS